MCKKLTAVLLLTISSALSMQAQETEQTPEVAPAAEVTTTTVKQAQPRFGYLSYAEVIRLMPEYASAQEKLDNLQAKYDAEMQRSDKEFNRKFAEFLEGQKDFPKNILVKRQKELQDLMEKSIAFKQEMKNLLAEAKTELLAPVTAALDKTIASVAASLNLEYVLNTDGNACPYVNPTAGLDITPLVKEKLNIQ